VEEAGALGEVVFWTRSGSSGSSRYSTLLWGGDQNVDWSYSDGLPSAITAGNMHVHCVRKRWKR